MKADVRGASVSGRKWREPVARRSSSKTKLLARKPKTFQERMAEKALLDEVKQVEQAMIDEKNEKRERRAHLIRERRKAKLEAEIRAGGIQALNKKKKQLAQLKGLNKSQKHRIWMNSKERK